MVILAVGVNFVKKHELMNSATCAALFDLDGVLIDSESVYSRFWTEIDRIYPTGIPDYALHIKGTTLPEILKDFPDPMVRADILHRISEFQASMSFELFPGVSDFLTALSVAGVPSAIVTSSDSRKMDMLFSQLPDLRRHFSVVIDASQVSRSKPDPQGYLLAAEALGVNPHDCFVFEDSIQGLKAGCAAGATVVALATTYPRTTVAPLAMHVIDSFVGFGVSDMLAVRCR